MTTTYFIPVRLRFIFSKMEVAVSHNSHETIELYFSCVNLPDKDVMSKSDPCIRLMCQNRGAPSAINVGQTEVLQNNLNPTFKRAIPFIYQFESQQTLNIQCVDIDGQGSNELLGQATCTMAEIMMSPPEGLTLALQNSSKKKSTVTIRYIRIGETNKSYLFKVRCTKVKDIEWFSKSDPFLRIYRPSPHFEGTTDPNQVPAQGWVQIHETEFHKDNLNPVFNQFTLNGATLNRGNSKMINRWEIWDYSNRGKHELIGFEHRSVSDILNGSRHIETRDLKGKFAGNILLDDVRAVVQYPISEYIRMGLNLNLSIAVDFTGSNGIQKSPSSLHYLSSTMNQYQNAIVEVGIVIMDYDYDKMIPAYGFGAKLQGTGGTSFCFPLNRDYQRPQLQSWEGVLQAYTQLLPTLEFSGPTNFSPIIQETLKAVKLGSVQNKMAYSILMILTDGLITDYQETVQAIVEASSLPMSIIIIGVGNEDFSQMDRLDADQGVLKDHFGKVALRDIVQFVPFRQFAHCPAMLSEAVLRELPRQVDQFYQAIGMAPQL